MSNPRIKKIMKELGRWYGIQSKFSLSLQQPTDNSNSNGRLLEMDEFIETLISKSSSSPSVEAILAGAKNLGDSSARPLLITPYGSSSPLPDNPISWIINDKDKGQGNLFKDGKRFYTTEDYIDLPEPSGESLNTFKNKISVLQNFSPSTTPASVDADVASLFLNSITTLEMSRAVPYIEVGVSSAVSKNADEDDKKMPPMTLGRFLLGPNASVSDAGFLYSKPVVEPLYDSVEQIEKDKGKMKLLAGMEAFTAPQTMVNAGLLYGDDGKINPYKVDLTDPFQPFMSLESMSLSVQGQGGLMSYKSGNIEMILHDKSRLSEITPLISPSRFGTTRLTITYGYSHPNSRIMERQTLNERENNLIGELVDCMRVTETYMVTNSSFNFDKHTVKISLKISLIGSKTLNEIDVTSISNNNGQETEVETKKIIQNLLNIMSNYNSENQKNNISVITVPSFLQNYSNITTSGISQKQIEELKKFRSSVNKSGNGFLKNFLDAVLGTNTSKVGGIIKTAIDSKNDQLNEIINQLSITPDPYLAPLDPTVHQVKLELNQTSITNAPKSKVVKPTYISFGKIISYFVGKALCKHYSEISDKFEVQFFFHPFNQDAAGMQDYNISQFPVLFTDFEEILKAHYTVFGSLSISKFMTLMVDYFINDLGAAAYGFLNDKDRRQNKRVKDQNFKRVNYTENNSEIKKENVTTAAEIISQRKTSQLKATYGLASSDFPVQFRKPEVIYEIQTTPMRNELDEKENDANKNNGIVIKIHVMDRAHSPAHNISNLLNTVGTNRLVPNILKYDPWSRSKQNNFIYCNNHARYAKKPYELMENNSYLKAIEEKELEDIIEKRNKEIAENGGTPKSLPDEINIDINALKKVAENYLLFKTPDNTEGASSDKKIKSVKDIISEIYPILRYGTASSGILNLSVGSMNDSSLTNIMLVRNGKESYGSEGMDPTGIPIAVMPVELSAETLGCPYFSYAQFFYIDLRTNTNIDNVYSVTNITHNISPGKFNTSIKMVQIESYGVFRPLTTEMQHVALTSALYQLGYKKVEPPKTKKK